MDALARSPSACDASCCGRMANERDPATTVSAMADARISVQSHRCLILHLETIRIAKAAKPLAAKARSAAREVRKDNTTARKAIMATKKTRPRRTLRRSRMIGNAMVMIIMIEKVLLWVKSDTML